MYYLLNFDAHGLHKSGEKSDFKNNFCVPSVVRSFATGGCVGPHSHIDDN